MSTEERGTQIERLIEALPEGSVLGWECHRSQDSLMVERSALLPVMETLKTRFGFRYLIDVTALDFHPATPRFRVVYHLWAHDGNRLLRLKTTPEGNPPAVPSVSSIWATANWHERECFDLFGIVFEGHPNLMRILLPLDWDGHPLRKDYPVEGP